MLAALRIELGRLHNRFPYHPKLQAELVAISADLNTAKVDNPNLTKIAADWKTLEPNLRQAYDRSLYEAGTIDGWVATK